MSAFDNKDDCLGVVDGARKAPNLLYVTCLFKNIDVFFKTCFAGFAGMRCLNEP
jgi:hypothetical protein